jgi:prepilin peptidase CpaA
MSAAIWLTLAGCLIAGYTDVRTRRIPNWLTGSLAVGALIFHSFAGLRPALVSLIIMLVLTLLGTLAYSRGGIGGGDIKLAVAASGMLSYPLFVPFLLYTAIGGGLLSIVFIGRRARAIATAGNAPGVAPSKSEMLPYAAAFAFGAALVTLSQSIAPFLRISL